MSGPAPPNRVEALRRVVDVVVAVFALAVLLVPLVLLAVAIKLDSPGPVLFRQKRVGRDGKLFTILKLRTMVAGADRRGAAVSGIHDARVTRTGRVLRAAKLDELPQLWNVLRGDMALIGPRPEVPEMVRFYDERERRILQVRPGLTCPGQVYFSQTQAAELDRVEDAEAHYVAHQLHDKLALDLAYLDSRSWHSDLALVVRTGVLLLRAGAAMVRPGHPAPDRAEQGAR